MRGNALELLSNHPLFSALPEQALRSVARWAQVRGHTPGSLIQLQDEPCRAVHFVAQGQVRVYRISFQGREQDMTRLGPGDAFNLVPVFEGGPNPATVEALTPVTLCTFRRDDFLRLVRDHPELALAILRDFAAKLRHLTLLVEDLSLRTVGARLARLLLTQAAEAGEAPRRMTQQEMAAQLGTVREMISRTLRDFEERGLIHLDRHRIVITDKKGLEEKAMF